MIALQLGRRAGVLAVSMATVAGALTGSASAQAATPASWLPAGDVACLPLQYPELLPAGQDRWGTYGFGTSVAISADGLLALVGAPWQTDGEYDGAGVVTAYTRVATNLPWSDPAPLPMPPRQEDQGFGTSLALSADGSTALVSEGMGSNRADPSVSVWAYSRTAGVWSSPTLVYGAPSTRHGEGFSLGLSGNGLTAVVGDPEGSAPGAAYPGGAVLVFARTGATWTQSQRLPLPDDAIGVGDPVAISRDGLAVAAGGYRGSQPIRLFGRANPSDPFTATAEIEMRNAADDLAWVASSLALDADGSTLLAGSGSGDSDAIVYSRSGTDWSVTGRLPVPTGAYWHLGLALDPAGTTALVGEDVWGDYTTGRVSVYRYARTGWTATDQLTPPEVFGYNAHFGLAVAMSDDGSTLVGAPDGTGPSFDRAGSVAAWELCPSGPAPTPPGPPTDVTAQAGVKSLAVAWTAPASDGGTPVTGYTARAWATAIGGTEPVATCAAADSSGCTITGLRDAAIYYLDVVATNLVGAGPPSSPRIPKATPGMPGAPTGVTVSAGSTRLAVAWSAPGSNGGSPVTGYTARAWASATGGTTPVATCLASGLAGCSVTGLVNGTTYYLDVVATNAVGTGPASAPRVSASPAGVPAAPTSVSVVPANAMLLVWWNYADSTGGAPVTGYIARAWAAATGGTTPIGSCTLPGSARTLVCAVTGLVNGTIYFVDVVAVNTIGTSPASAPRVARAAGVAPGAPTNVSVRSADRSLAVSWTAPTVTGGAPVTGYTARAWATATGGTTPMATCPAATASGCTITGLVNGVTYFVDVVATNVIGTGPASAPRVARAPATLPGTPGGVRVTPAYAALVVAWNPPASNGGSPITKYTARAWTAPHGYWVGSCETLGVTTCVISGAHGLTNLVTYYVDVTATNAIGTGPGIDNDFRVPGTPTPLPADWGTWQQVSTGAGHSCGVTTAGAAYCWGANDSGQLGNGGTTASPVPVPVTGLTQRVASIEVGWGYTCAVTYGHQLFCWGRNNNGQLGNGTRADSAVPVPVTRLGWTVSAVSANWGHTCAVAGGAAHCWGYQGDEGRLGNGGRTSSAVPVPVFGLASGVTSISAGYEHSCAIRSTGSSGSQLLCWGSNRSGQLGNGTTADSARPVQVGSGFTAVATGQHHSCGIRTGGAAFCWGGNYAGQLGTGSTRTSLVPAPVSGLSAGVRLLSTKDRTSCAVVMGGQQALCWGENHDGLLGNGGNASSLIPTGVVGLASRVALLSAGATATCAVTAGGRALCWGVSWSVGQLGNGGVTGSTVPVPVLRP